MAANAAINLNVEVHKIFEPDPLASAQFYENTKRTYHANPELRLMAAVLEDAVATVTTDQRRCSGRQRREFEETMRWVVQSEDHDWIFSFVNVCESLGVDADYLRAGLIRKVHELRDAPGAAHRGKGRYLSPRRKVVRMGVG